jgi:hypothetical protein
LCKHIHDLLETTSFTLPLTYHDGLIAATPWVRDLHGELSVHNDLSGNMADSPACRCGDGDARIQPGMNFKVGFVMDSLMSPCLLKNYFPKKSVGAKTEPALAQPSFLPIVKISDAR